MSTEFIAVKLLQQQTFNCSN